MNEEFFNNLKSASDSMDPLTHDGSYTLIQKVVEAYANIHDNKAAWEKLDYNDLNLLLHLVIGTWKQNIEIKKKSVDNSNLLDKTALKDEIDSVWDKALSNKYRNKESGKASIGMFGTGFYSFKTKTDEESVKKFIGLLVDIYFKADGNFIKDLSKNNEFYDMAAKVLNNGVKGMGAASVSQILHCLQPYVFPVLNSASKEFYSSWKLKGITKVENYIDNCREINKELLSHGIKVFNYRILDIEAVKTKSDYQKAFEVWLDRQNDIDREAVTRCSEAVLSATDLVEESFLNDNTIYSEKDTDAIRKCIEYIELKLRDSEQSNRDGFVIDSLNRYKDFLSYIEECKASNDVQKFKNLLKWFVEQIKINNDIIEGKHTSGQGYQGKGLRDKYIDFHQYNGFTLDCTIQGGWQKSTKSNYIHLTGTWINICPIFKKDVNNKHDVDGLQIEIKPDKKVERNYAVIKLEDLDLFNDNEANDNLKELFALFKNEIDTYQYNNSPDNLNQNEGNNDKKEKMTSKNIILYGPPGTGKTYNTVRKAVEIIEPDKGWGDKDYKAVKEEYNKLLNEGRINFVTFHQSHGYEEFIEGIKPSTDGGNVTYKVEQGVFLQFCENAKKAENKDKNFVFIIDEINRGNISKIFGELITLIEDNKRDGAIEAMSVKLPYSHKSFSVPDNIYIIGTMNTADRSIAAIDTALRRRFTFIEMMPDYAVLKGVKVSDIDIAEMLKTMNERIAVLYDREHTIGHAYFMPLKNKDEPKIADLKDIFRNKILPLLQEYFYEDYGKIRLVLGDKQKGENEQFIIKGQLDYNGLFGSTDEIDLGERTDIYKINKKHLEDKNLTDVFLNPKAYIGIYDVTDVKPSESHG